MTLSSQNCYCKRIRFHSFNFAIVRPSGPDYQACSLVLTMTPFRWLIHKAFRFGHLVIWSFVPDNRGRFSFLFSINKGRCSLLTTIWHYHGRKDAIRKKKKIISYRIGCLATLKVIWNFKRIPCMNCIVIDVSKAVRKAVLIALQRFLIVSKFAF